MNCTKCGKEIPEGEKKICDECQAKVLEEIANEEKNNGETTSEEKKTENSEAKSKKILPILIVVILIVIALAVAAKVTVFDKKGNGNTIGNIRNYGYGAVSGNWIYFLSPNENSSNVGIYKVKKDGTDKKELVMNENGEEIVSINVVGNYIYFIKITEEAYSDEDPIDNKICRIKKDGTDLEVINDNELNNDCYEFYVVNGQIYYIDVDANVSKMNLDGSNKTVVAENGTGYIGITENYILYNDYKDENSSEYVTYIMDIDGKNQRSVIDGKRLYSINVEGDYIYYTGEDKKIYRTKIDSKEEELVYDTEAYNLNVENGYAYYLNYLDAENEDLTVGIYKVSVEPSEGKEAELLKTLDTYSSFLNVVGDWILYMDSGEKAGWINLLKTDGSGETVELYYLDYEQYYNSQATDDNAEIPDNGTTDEVTTENVASEDVSTNTTVDEQNLAENVTSNNAEQNNN